MSVTGGRHTNLFTISCELTRVFVCVCAQNGGVSWPDDVDVAPGRGEASRDFAKVSLSTFNIICICLCAL